jgi:hypothetical protein
LIAKRAGLYLTSRESLQLQDYIDNRLILYIKPITLSVSYSRAMMILNKFQTQIPSISVLSKWFKSSIIANALQKDDDYYIFGKEPLDFGTWLQTRAYKEKYIPTEIKLIKFNDSELILEDYNGKKYKQGDEYFNAAIIHALSLIGLSVTIGGVHSWIHIHLPCIVSDCVYGKNIFKEGSVLQKLFTQHTRFVPDINNQVLWNPMSTQWNQESLYFSFPFDWEDSQLGGIYDGTIQKYKLDTNCFFEEYNNYSFDLPYNQYLSSYYQIIEKFIIKLIPFIDETEYVQFENYLKSKYIGRWFDSRRNLEYRMNKLLTCLMHLLTVQHSADHYTFWRGISTIQPAIRLTESIKDMKVENFLKNQYEIACTFNANNVFSYTFINRSIPNLFNVEYNFMSSELQYLQNEFKNNLKNNEKNLKNKKNNLCPSECIFTSISG